MTQKDLHDRVVQVGTAIRKMGAQSVITSQTVADRFGMHTTDLEVLDLIFLRKQASAGELADATGLSSGSVTALIDRLARAGYVERCPDADDRRRVIVRIRPDAIEPIKSVYMAMQKRMFALWSTYSVRDLEVINDFILRSTALAIECCKGIRQSAPAASRRRPLRAGRRRGDGTPGPKAPPAADSTARKRKQVR